MREGRIGLARVGAGTWMKDPSIVAGIVPDRDPTEKRPHALAAEALDRLVDQAQLTERERKSCAVLAGTTTGFNAEEEIAFLAAREATGVATHQWKLFCGGPGQLASFAARRLGARGPAMTFTTACTSTSVALMQALRLLRAGRAERVVVVGLEVLLRMSVEGFRFLQLYSEDRCRPFDRARCGIQLGEAAGALLLEPRRDRGARFELLDGCVRHDPSHVASGSTDGATAATVIREALQRSQVAPGEVTAVKAHGTGTPSNDLSELRALQAVFGERPPPFASLKGVFGHTAGCSGVLETAVWTWCLAHGFVPPSGGFEEPMEEAPLAPLTRPLETGGRPGTHLFNAFGFGGTSVAFLMRDHGA